MFAPPPIDALDSAAVSTGSLRIDYALTTGGILPGELLIIEGLSGCGKTIICQQIVAEAQKLGGLCAWIDSDHTFEAGFALRCGVDPQRLWVLQPPNAEAAMDALFELTFSRSLAVIVIDSADSLVGVEELERLTNPQFRPAARPEEAGLSYGLGRIAPYLMRGWTRLVVTRGALPEAGPSYHRLSARLPGMALSARATARLQLKNARLIKDAGGVVGLQAAVRILRPQGVGGLLRRAPGMGGSANPRRAIPECCTSTFIDMMYNQGIIKIGEVFDLGLWFGLIQSQRGGFHYQHRELGTDREIAIQSLEAFGLAEPLEQVVRRKLLWT